ncbi:MAG: hypothetical protein JWM11_4467, partial [Planctomycetaceae bacterium]|nr:hypothetical protein [Planctomycetaceae bacterium]
MKPIRQMVLGSSLLCLALSTFAIAGPGGSYGPGLYGPSGGYGNYDGYGPVGASPGYGGPGNVNYGSGNYSGGGFGGSFGHGPTIARTPSVYIGSNRPYGAPNSEVIKIRPAPNTTITVTEPIVKRPYYEGLPPRGYNGNGYGAGYNGGYNNGGFKPAVIGQPGNFNRPIVVGGNNVVVGNNSGYYHRPQYYNGGWYHGDWRSNLNNSWKSRPYSWGG